MTQEGRAANRYAQIIERIFFTHYREGERYVDFARGEIEETAVERGQPESKRSVALPRAKRWTIALRRVHLSQAAKTCIVFDDGGNGRGPERYGSE
jgi:hypothetical protein